MNTTMRPNPLKRWIWNLLNEWVQASQAAMAFSRCAYCDQCGIPVTPPLARYCSGCGCLLPHTERIPALPAPHAATPTALSGPTQATVEEEEEATLPKPPGTLARDWRKAHPDQLLDTQGYRAIHLKNELRKIELRSIK